MLDFPNNPTTGQQWIGSNGALYTWDGTVWALTSPVAGSFQWMDTNTQLQPIRAVNYPISCGPITLLGSGTTLTPALSFQNIRPANAPTAQGDSLLSIGYWGYDGSALQRAGDISVQAAELWGGPGRGCNLYISTTPTGATTRQIRLGFVGSRYTYFDNLTGLRVGDATQIPREMLDVKGATVLGPSTNATPVDGTLQYTGTIFQGRVGGTWVNIPGQAVLTGPAGGSLIGTYPNPGIANGAVGVTQLAPGVTGNLLPAWDPVADIGKAPVVQPSGNVAWAIVTATGSAGGSLTGTYPNPTIALNAISTGMVINGAITDPKIASLSYSKLSGAPAIPTTLPPSGPAGGDLNGNYPNPGVWNAGGDFHVGQDLYVGRNTNAANGTGAFAQVETVGVRYWTGSAYGNQVAFLWTGSATQLKIDGIVQGTINITPSDERIKVEVQEDVPGLDAVRALHPISFRYKPGFHVPRADGPKIDEPRHYGLIAQEARMQVPLVVSESETDERYLELDYRLLVPVLIKAIQELDARVR